MAGEEEQKHLSASLSDSEDDQCPTLGEDETPQQGEGLGEQGEDESAGDDEDGASSGSIRGKQSRNEKKARKAVLRHGLKHMTGITRVIIRKNKHMLFVVSSPEVYKSTSSDTYVIFGEAKAENLNSQAHSAAAQRFTQATNMHFQPGFPSSAATPGGATTAAASPAAADSGTRAEFAEEMREEQAGDESNIDPKDILLVMSQVECSRAKAVAALKANNNDIVEAIMQLSGN